MLNINAHERLKELEEKEAAEAARDKESSKYIYRIPDEKSPLVVKFIVDPRSGTRYVPMTYFKHKIGPNESDTRTHVSLSSINKSKAPENEFYWENKKKLSVLKKAGQGDSAEAKKLDTLVKTFAPKQGGYIYVCQPDSPEVRVLKLNQMMINEIFGRDANAYQKEVRGIMAEGRDTGVSPFFLDRLDGWVKIWKTGTGLATEYKVAYVTSEVEEELKSGKKIKVTQMTEMSVHPKILDTFAKKEDAVDGGLTMNDFPDVIEREAKWAWTEAESIRFVEGYGSIASVPDRVLPRSKKDETDEPTQQADAASAQAAVTLTVEASEDMPF